MELSISGTQVTSASGRFAKQSSPAKQNVMKTSNTNEASTVAAAVPFPQLPPAAPARRVGANRGTVEGVPAAPGPARPGSAVDRLSVPPARRKVAPRNVTASAIASRLSKAGPPPLPAWAAGSGEGSPAPPPLGTLPQQEPMDRGSEQEEAEEEVRGLKQALDDAGHAATAQQWLATYSTLSLASRSIERTLSTLLRLHAVKGAGAEAELRRALDESAEEVASERATLSTALGALRERVPQVRRGGHRPGSERGAAAAAEDYSTAVREFREAARKAYVKLSSEEQSLGTELQDVHTLLLVGGAGDGDAQGGAEGDIPQELQKGSGGAEDEAVNTSLLSLRSSPLVLPVEDGMGEVRERERFANGEPTGEGKHTAQATPGQIIKALKARMTAVEHEIERAGGSLGGWLDEDHRTFLAQLTLFLSARGRHHALRFSAEAAGGAAEHSAAVQRALAAASGDASASLPSALPSPLLSPSEASLFLDRISSCMPGWGRAQLAAHLTWYMWWRSAQEERLACVAAWKVARKSERGIAPASGDGVVGAGAVEDTSYAGSTGPGGKTDLATRVALAEWKAQREAEAQRKAAVQATARAAQEEADRAAVATRLAVSKARVDAWKADKEAMQAAQAAVKMREEMILAAERRAESDAAARRQAVKEDIAAAAARRKAAEEAARAKAQAHARRFGPDDPSYASRVRAESAARAEWDWWEGSLPPDPDRPTVAQVARAQTVQDREEASARVARASAHAKPVASVIPTARGKGFAFGVSAGALPSRATPSWRKGL